MRAFLLVTVILVAACLTGCGVYSFSSSSLGGVKTVAIPQFENKSLEYAIQEDLTAKVIEKFIADNSLKVVGLGDADAVLRGEVVKYERVAYTYDKANQVAEYKVNIIISFILERKGGKPLLEKSNMLGFGIYSTATETEDLGKQRALDKLATDIVDETTKSW